jgi:alpha/beta superfamily hydrolase
MERPDAPRGIALIAHPHPMGGGANTNKVAYTLAKTFVSLGYAAFRPNFRGVGGTEGEHDEGVGETDDLLAVLAEAKCRCGNLPVALAGFSFGAYCQTRVAKRLTKPVIPRSAWSWSAPPPVLSKALASTTPKPCRTTPSSFTARLMKPCRSPMSSTGPCRSMCRWSSCPVPTISFTVACTRFATSLPAHGGTRIRR